MIQRLRLSLFLLTGVLLATASPALAQPHGWACDYGQRPGNTWFYRSADSQGKIHSETIASDSLGTDGSYWVVVRFPPSSSKYWLRFDSACVVDRFLNPLNTRYEHWFLPMADSGDVWVVDSTPPQFMATIYDTYSINVFGRNRRATRVLYYQAESVEGWSFAIEWAEGIGITRRWSHPSSYEEIVGAIIDSIAYGNTTGVDDLSSESGKHLSIRPSPGSSDVVLDFVTAGNEGATLEVHDILGRLMLQRTLGPLSDGHHTINLDISNLPSAPYLVTLAVNGIPHSQLFVVAR